MATAAQMYSRVKSTYYGWWVLLAATLLAMMSGGVLNHGASVFFNPIKRDLNLSSASTSLIFTISRAQAGLVGPLFGWLVDRFGARPLILIGSVGAGLGLILIHRINSYLPFLLVYVLVIGLSAQIGFGQTLLTSVNRWFGSRRATAMAILLTGFAAGGAIFIFPLSLGVERIGWRSTLLYSGIFVLIVGVILSRFVRHSPEHMGIALEGEYDAGERGVSTSHAIRERVSPDFSISEAMRTKVFWILLAASTLRISAETGIFVHVIPILVWKGLDEQAAAGFVSLFFLMSIPFRLLLGMSGQRMAFQPLIVTGMLSAVTGLVLLAVSGGIWGLYLFVFLMAIYEGSVVLQWVAVGDFFGRQNYGTLTGIMRLFDTVGSVVAPFFAGFVFDRTGSYAPALITFAAMLGAAGLLYSISRRPVRLTAPASARRAA